MFARIFELSDFDQSLQENIEHHACLIPIHWAENKVRSFLRKSSITHRFSRVLPRRRSDRRINVCILEHPVECLRFEIHSIQSVSKLCIVHKNIMQFLFNLLQFHHLVLSLIKLSMGIKIVFWFAVLQVLSLSKLLDLWLFMLLLLLVIVLFLLFHFFAVVDFNYVVKLVMELPCICNFLWFRSLNHVQRRHFTILIFIAWSGIAWIVSKEIYTSSLRINVLITKFVHF